MYHQKKLIRHNLYARLDDVNRSLRTKQNDRMRNLPIPSWRHITKDHLAISMPQSTASNLGVSKRGNSPMICTQFLLLHTLNEIILLQEIPPHVNWQSLGRQSLHCSSLKSRAQNQYVYLTALYFKARHHRVDWGCSLINATLTTSVWAGNYLPM